VRGRGAIVGQERVREAARSGRLALAIVASDASSNTRQKLLPLLSARRVTLMEVPSAADLGTAVGRQQTAAVGILDPNLAEGICVLGVPVRRVDEEGV
jgi:ribosomal protein L7Ae-like RNA K-turn-binding protein